MFEDLDGYFKWLGIPPKHQPQTTIDCCELNGLKRT